MTLLPDDPYNQTLAALTHPSDWVNPKPRGRYNLVVVGAGTAGLVAAAGAAGLGARVALIEKHQSGGDCLNVGCVPSKALIRSARAIYDARRLSDFGANSSTIEVDFGEVMKRMRRLRAGIAPNDSFRRFKDLGVEMFLGEAKFVSQMQVEINGTRLDFSKALIATGSRASIPPLLGLADAGYFTHETLFSLTQLPKRWLVLGGGPIGCELSQCLRRFGAEVTLMSRDPRLLPREDIDAASILQSQFQSEGIHTVLGTTPIQVTRVGNARKIDFNSDDKLQSIEVDAILVAVGRTPNIETLGLDSAGVHLKKGGALELDDALRTSNKRIFASGDVAGQWQFTHAADAMGRVVLQNTLFWGRKKANTLTIPWSTYTDPEIAHVGLYELEAKKRGIDVATYTVPFSEVDRAILESEDSGFARIHADRRTGHILGASYVGRDAGDLIGEMALAVTHRLTLGQLASTVHPYPTRAEAWKKIGDLHSRTRLTPRVKAIFKKLMAWQR